MKIIIAITTFTIILFSSCATFRATNFRDYIKQGKSILILPPTANINGIPIKLRLEEKKENIAVLSADSLEPESDFIVDDGIEFGINVMNEEEHVLAKNLQNELLKHFSKFNADTLVHDFPCDVNSFVVSEYVLSECKIGYSNIPDLDTKMKEICMNSKSADLLIISRLNGKFGQTIPMGTSDVVSAIIPSSAPLFDLARIAGIMPEKRLTTIGTTFLETAIIDIRKAKIIFYEGSSVDIPPFYQESITELLKLNLEQIQ
jgi:hypothetical protein